jgi:thiol-disulfide isomerase/thioredoxin
MLKKSILSTAFAFAILFNGCSDDTSKDTNATTETVNSMITPTHYVLKSLKDQEIIVKKELDGYTIENSKGKIIIFDIFATWCPPCQGAVSHLSSLQDKFKDDIKIIGLTIEDGISNEKLQEFSSEFKANYTFVNSEDNRRLIDAIATSLQLGERFPIPLMVMYKDGKLVKFYQGAVQEEFIESDIKQALGK